MYVDDLHGPEIPLSIAIPTLSLTSLTYLGKLIRFTMSTTQTGVPKSIGYGISVIDFPAHVLYNAKYRLDENNNTIGEIIDFANTERIPDDDASIGLTWNGTEKRYAATFKVVSEDGTQRYLNSIEFTPSHSFNVTDKDNSTEQRAAVSLCWSRPNETADFDSVYLLVTKGHVHHPSAVVEAAPVTSSAASTNH